MSITLQRFNAGDTNYITKHNTNCGTVETNINAIQQDVDALRQNSGAGTNNDYRLLAMNLLINGAFDYWQRGNSSKPDGWTWENYAIGSTISRNTSTLKVNNNSAKIVGQGQLTQALQSKILDNVSSGFSFAFCVWVKSDTVDKTRIGIYDGVTTSYADYHSGDDDWELHYINYVQSSETIPSTMKFVIDNGSGATAYFNSACLIRGNPSRGSLPIVNDPIIEKMRVMALYEVGWITLSGVGILDGSDRQLRQRITFSVLKTDVPVIVLPNADDKTSTGQDIYTENVDERGFDLVLDDIGGISGTDGIKITGLKFTAEVI